MTRDHVLGFLGRALLRKLELMPKKKIKKLEKLYPNDTIGLELKDIKSVPLPPKGPHIIRTSTGYVWR